MNRKAIPDIAVLMPVYNPGTDIAMTLASIKSQRAPARLYLIDDGSIRKPDYKELLNGMDHVLIELPQNLGITGALNAGLAKILDGDFAFVVRVDNGDINDPERFQVQKDYLQRHPELAMVASHVRFEYEVTVLKVDSIAPEKHEHCARALRYNPPLTHAAIIVKTH